MDVFNLTFVNLYIDIEAFRLEFGLDKLNCKLSYAGIGAEKW